MALILKRKNNSSGITGYDDAAMFHMMLGNGIFNGVYSSMRPSVSNGVFIIQPGMLLYGGRLVEVERNSTASTNVTSFSGAAYYIMMEVTITGDDDDSESSVAICASTTNTETSGCPVDGAGTYRAALFHVAVSGTISTLYPVLEPGVAKNALNLLSTGKIGSTDFSDVFILEGGAVQGVWNADTADYALEAQGFVGGDINAVSQNLYLANRGVYIMQEAPLVSTDGVTELASGASQIFSFINGASLSQMEGAVAAYFEVAGGVSASGFAPYAGTAIETKGTFELVEGVLDAYINHSSSSVTVDGVSVPAKSVMIRNFSDAAVSLSSVKLAALIYGGGA